MKHIPANCMAAPGYIVPVKVGGCEAWLTHDLKVTNAWSKRGIWPTQESAKEAIEAFFGGKDEKTFDT